MDQNLNLITAHKYQSQSASWHGSKPESDYCPQIPVTVSLLTRIKSWIWLLPTNTSHSQPLDTDQILNLITAHKYQSQSASWHGSNPEFDYCPQIPITVSLLTWIKTWIWLLPSNTSHSQLTLPSHLPCEKYIYISDSMPSVLSHTPNKGKPSNRRHKLAQWSHRLASTTSSWPSSEREQHHKHRWQQRDSLARVPSDVPEGFWAGLCWWPHQQCLPLWGLQAGTACQYTGPGGHREPTHNSKAFL